MGLGEDLLADVDERAASFEIFRDSIDPAWITAALEATGTATIRRRKLPAEYVVWLVIGMGLLHDRPITEVVRHLDLVLPPPAGGRGTVSGAAIAQARTRLGPEPLAALFRQTAAHWATHAADGTRWHGLAVYGVDGTTLRVADTPENLTAFGRPGSRHGDGGGYPQLRLVALMVPRSHLLAGIALGSYRTSELTLAAELWPLVPPDSITLVDRGFATYTLFQHLHDPATNRHWLTRKKQGLTVRQVQTLGPGDALVDLVPSRATRVLHPDLPERLRVRAVRYHRPGFRPQTLLTSLLDPVAYPAAALATLYHERWELELGFDEVKTHTLDRHEALRSTSPARVRQEVWGLALGYNLVRLAIARAAVHAGVPSLRIRYRHALLLIRSFWASAWHAAPGVLPKRLAILHAELATLVLPERRPRRYPRAVKIKMSNYPRKRPRQRRIRVK
jgi:hypothetical protein